MQFKEYFNLFLEYRVNIDNVVQYYKLTTKEKTDLNEVLVDKLQTDDPWYKFEIADQTYLVGYMRNVAHLVFFNLTDTLGRTDKTAQFGELHKLNGQIFRFINTICSIMKRLVDKEGVLQIKIHHTEWQRMDLYYKFLTNSVSSFLPGYTVFVFAGDIIVYRPLTENQKSDDSVKGRSLRSLIEQIELGF